MKNKKMNEKKLNEIIFQNIGQASMCWSLIPDGIFNSTKAEMLGQEILDAIYEYIDTLKYENDTNKGLWATDKPELIPENIKEYFFQIK